MLLEGLYLLGRQRCNPYHVFKVAPDEVGHIARTTVSRTGTVTGSWDAEPLPIEQTALYSGLEQRFVQGFEWADTDLSPDRYRRLSESEPERYENFTRTEFLARGADLDGLYEEMSSHGYIPYERRGASFQDVLALVVGHEGTFMATSSGLHRLVIAKLLGLPAIPARIVAMHPTAPRLPKSASPSRHKTWEAGASILRSAITRLVMRNSVSRRILGTWQRPRERVVSRSLGVPGLFRALENQGVDYVVLRWFESLPDVAPGQDIDLLVSDDGAHVVDGLLKRTRSRRGIPCDVYSVTGLPSFDLRGAAYFPPTLASEILARAVQHPQSGARVPCAEDHFRSLAYHAIYKKGYKSGLPVSATEGPRDSARVHDYATALAELASRLDVNVAITMEDLDHYLGQVGWRPSFDHLGKWRKSNAFCAQLHDRLAQANIEGVPDGLVVFVVRERAAHPEVEEQFRRTIRAQGFREAGVHVLDEGGVERACREIRGGNWGRGPFPASGGLPHTLLVYVDPAPMPPTADQLLKYPGLDNLRIRRVKYVLRQWWNDYLPPSQRCNVLHSSDNASHAAHYLRSALPDVADNIIQRAALMATDPEEGVDQVSATS